MKKCVIVHKIGVARCMVYRATIQIQDENDVTVKEIVKEYPKRSRGFVRDASIELAIEEARVLGFDHIQEIQSTEGEFSVGGKTDGDIDEW